MADSQPQRHHRSKRVLIAAMVIVLATAAGVYFGYRRLVGVSEQPLALKTGAEGMVVAGVRQSSTRDGRTEWSLDAASAQYLMSEKKVLLKDIAVTFYTRDGQKVFLTARNGTVLTATNDMEAHDDVVIWNDQYRLVTQNVNYRNQQRVIESDSRSKIIGERGEISGDSLTVDLNANQFEMRGRILAILPPR